MLDKGSKVMYVRLLLLTSSKGGIGLLRMLFAAAGHC